MDIYIFIGDNLLKGTHPYSLNICLVLNDVKTENGILVTSPKLETQNRHAFYNAPVFLRAKHPIKRVNYVLGYSKLKYLKTAKIIVCPFCSSKMAYSDLNGNIMVQNGYFGLLGNYHILVYYPSISYQRIEVYRVETMDMGRFCWNNSISGKWNPSKYYSDYCMGKILW